MNLQIWFYSIELAFCSISLLSNFFSMLVYQLAPTTRTIKMQPQMKGNCSRTLFWLTWFEANMPHLMLLYKLHYMSEKNVIVFVYVVIQFLFFGIIWKTCSHYDSIWDSYPISLYKFDSEHHEFMDQFCT